MMLESTVSYLNYGSSATYRSLGGVIAGEQALLQSGVLWCAVPPMIVLSLIVLGLHVLGDWIGRVSPEQ
jgi:ABC-type dipeptide/oligopeptide/nickel transport system permease subunit